MSEQNTPRAEVPDASATPTANPSDTGEIFIGDESCAPEGAYLLALGINLEPQR